MERRSFHTPLGEIWLTGRPDAFEGGNPLVILIYGAFAADLPDMHPLADHVVGAGVLFAHLPGNHCPALAETSVAAFAAAFDHVLQGPLQRRRVVICGESVGGLVALAVAASNVHRLALDPPLKTAKLWPLIPIFKRVLVERPEHTDFCWNVLGIASDRIEDRDYTPKLTRRARVLVGEAPLFPVRVCEDFPSAVDEPERAQMRANPLIRLQVVRDTGHLVMRRASTAYLQVLNEMVAASRG